MTTAVTMPAEIHVRIGRLVVDGAEGLDPVALRAAVHEAIARSLSGAMATAAMADAMQAGPEPLARHCSLRIGEAMHSAVRAVSPASQAESASAATWRPKA